MEIQIVGYLLHWGLFGTLSIQLYLYYLAFPKDRQFVKSVVYGIYIVELVQTILVAHDAFAVFGYGFGDLEAITDMHFNWLILPVMIAIAAFVGQVFYAYRIYILSGSRIVPALVFCLSFTSAVASIITGVDYFQAGDLLRLNERMTSISGGILCGGSALCDIVIALYMTYYLTRSKTGFRRTQILVTKITRLTIETGSMTAIANLVAIILFLAFPRQTFYMAPSLVISKLYANSIYMVLNSRIQIMGGRDTYRSSTDLEITTTMIRDITSHPAEGAQRTPVVAIAEEAFSSDDETGQINVSHVSDPCALLELNFSQG
ncbi:hypothetical protein IW261DRAFT_1345158 [Armillaria novae-zelandiae]|uniref:DUF6534 domain-containing protein n=1 Tax=Armillaria novae-zelandiae TaxID=153914 RepID=A0AA39NS64_9AGAR|nr:hypothetical protein IW261DRAFT_1345158 [Armillaria novae-zelandiae]